MCHILMHCDAADSTKKKRKKKAPEPRDAPDFPAGGQENSHSDSDSCECTSSDSESDSETDMATGTDYMGRPRQRKESINRQGGKKAFTGGHKSVYDPVCSILQPASLPATLG